MNTNQKSVYETKALSILGTRTKAIRSELRNLPHELIDRGRRLSQARIYKAADVLALRKARWEKLDAELKEFKRLFK